MDDVNISDIYYDAYGNYDTRLIDYPGTIKIMPNWEAILKIAIYSIIMITAIIGNVLIILVVVRNKSMRTTTNFYIVNLAVSDLLVTCFCTWVRLVDNLTEGWVLGTFFCKANTFTQGNIMFHFTYHKNVYIKFGQCNIVYFFVMYNNINPSQSPSGLFVSFVSEDI